jgi:hypothetical protein
MTEPIEALQRMFLWNGAMQEGMRRGASAFWQNQDVILTSMEDLAEGWFERRRRGVEAALEAAQRMCACKTPAELAQEYQVWAMGACERIFADGLACQQHAMTVGGLVAASLPAAPEEAAAAPAARPKSPEGKAAFRKAA